IGDQFDGADADNNTFATAVNAGGEGLDTAALDDGEGGTAALPLNLCPGDIDYFMITHMGGPLDISATTIVGTVNADLRLATIDVDASLVDGLTVTAEGTPIALDATADLAAGYYLLRLTESGATIEAPAEYSFAFQPDCQADGGDSPIALLDDASTVTDPETVGISDDVAVDAFTAYVCNGDADAYAFDPLTTGDIAIAFTGAADLDIVVTSVVRGETVETPVTTTTDTVAGAVRTVTLVDVVPANRYIVRVSQATSTSTSVEYSFSADFRYDPPANDLCADAEGITADATAAVFAGTNVAGTSNMDGLCNGDLDAEEDKKGAEVFYGLSLTEASTNLELKIAGTDGSFTGSVTLFAAPDGCPTDLATLSPIGVNGTVVDAEDIGAACGDRIRLSNVPAGDYLAVAEGDAGAFVIIFDIPPSFGPFELTTQTFPEGFPPAEACVEALEITLPAAGASSTETIAFADFSAGNDLVGSCGGNGQERVLSFTAAANASVTFTTADDGPDTVVYLVDGTCGGSDDGAATCNDDNAADTGTGSALTVDVVAGTEYFLVVDTFRAITEGDVALTIAVE
ncbi:MAG TPA: hypothetical protein VGF99_09390, partial [Myxococcota bacterium]